MNDLNDRPTVSVIVTTSGRPQMLNDCLRSIAAQTLQPSEVIIVDDGSQITVDLSILGCDTRLLRLPSSVGPCGARNAGLLEARGSHVTFLDDDDLLPSTAIAQYVDAISHIPASDRDAVAFLGAIGFFIDPGTGEPITASDISVVDVNRPPSLPRGARYSLERIPSDRRFKVHNTLVVTSATLKDVGGWDIRLPAAEHTDLFLRINRVCELVGIDAVLYLMRRHPQVRLSHNAARNAAGMRLTHEMHQSVFAEHPRSAADFLSLTAVRFAQAGLFRQALLMLLRSLRACPAMLTLRRAVFVGRLRVHALASLRRRHS